VLHVDVRAAHFVPHLQHASQINLDDRIVMAEAVKHSAGDTLCDPMERRMNMLRGAVAQNRSSMMRSFIKAIGFPSRSSKGNLSAGDGREASQFSYESTECRLRQLGDMYFMIGQYQDAEGCYSDAADEFKLQRSVRHWAAALEALALARYMQMATLDMLGLEVWKCAQTRS
jgi:hypothetical protein